MSLLLQADLSSIYSSKSRQVPPMKIQKNSLNVQSDIKKRCMRTTTVSRRIRVTEGRVVTSPVPRPSQKFYLHIHTKTSIRMFTYKETKER
jgi:hypothetical protein